MLTGGDGRDAGCGAGRLDGLFMAFAGTHAKSLDAERRSVPHCTHSFERCIDPLFATCTPLYLSSSSRPLHPGQ